MSWHIVADSSCNHRTFDTRDPNITYGLAPLKINVGANSYIDDGDLDVEELVAAVSAEKSATSSACPSVGDWAKEFRKGDNVVAITISSSISGTMDAARMARDLVLEEYAAAHNGSIEGKNIILHDSRSAGAKLDVMVHHLVRYLSECDPSVDQVERFLDELNERSQIIVTLSHYDNLVKSGRLPRIAGNIAGKLNIRLMATASDEGTIQVVGPTRGEKKTYKKILERMESLGYHGGLVYIDQMHNPQGAQAVADVIRGSWPNAEIYILPCDGLCSYYAEETGMIVGFEWLD